MAGFELLGLEIEYFNLGRNLIKMKPATRAGFKI